MSTTVAASAALTEFAKLTGNTATAIYTASTGATRILSVTACENSGATPSLTLEAYDVSGTTSYYLRRVVALSVGYSGRLFDAVYVAAQLGDPCDIEQCLGADRRVR